MTTAEQGYTIHYIELSSGKVAYIDEGSGEQTIVMIHGLANYAGVWKKNIEELSKSYRCVAIDLPGNGYSEPGDHSYGMSFFGEVVYELVCRLNLGRVCLMGHSMGGQVAMTLALAHPEVVSKLALCAPAGFEEFSAFERKVYKAGIHVLDMFSTDENSLRKTLQMSFYMFPEQARPMIEELVALQKRYPARKYREMVEACIDSMLEEQVYDRLGEIKQPTLIIYGERDALIPNKLLHPVSTRELGLKAVEQFPDAELHTIARCGHFVHWEAASDVNHYVRSFVG